MPKIKIIVRLPDNRDYAGRLHVENAAGKRLAGPFPICGRANDPMARDSKNPTRDSILPFGDTPLGGYQVQKIIGSGDQTAYSSEEFGSSGIILLQPASGEAALADANGRFGFFIQGGALSRNGRLRPADGSLRLSNRDQRKLVSILRSCEPMDCECEVMEGAAKRGRRVADVPAASVFAQARALLTGLLGTTTLEPAHRALVKKMVLAGRVTISIPSLLMMTSQPALSQQTSVDKETRTLLASRDTTFSFPIMLAQAGAPATGNDYGGGHLTPFENNQPQNPDLTPQHNPQGGTDTQAIDQLNSINNNVPNVQQNPGLGYDTAGNPVTGGGGATPPLGLSGTAPDQTQFVPDPRLKDDSDVQNLNKYQGQLSDDQAAVAKAQADYDKAKQADPNANMAGLLDAQAKLKGTQNMVQYEQTTVKQKMAQLPPLPTGQTAAPSPTPPSNSK